MMMMMMILSSTTKKMKWNEENIGKILHRNGNDFSEYNQRKKGVKNLSHAMLSPFDGGIDQQKYGGGGSNQQNALIFWCSGPRMALSSACNRNKELKCQTLALKHRTWGVKKHTWEYLPTKRVYGILTDW